MNVISNNTNNRLILENAFIALGYWLISYINFLLFKNAGILPMPIWPAAAIALVASFYRGMPVAPGILIGALLSNYISLGASLPHALCISVTNTIGPEFVAYLMRKRVGLKFSFKSFGDVFICFTLALIIAPLITAIGGVYSTYLFGFNNTEQITYALLKWTLAHGLGTFFFALPFFIYYIHQDSHRDPMRHPCSSNSNTCSVIQELTLVFAVFFWIGDTIFELLWFPQQGWTIIDYFIPFGNMHELFMRIFIVLAFFISGFAVYKMAHILTEHEKEAITTAKNLSITLDSIGDGVISTDSKGIITKINPVAERLTGWSADEAIGKPMEKIFVIHNANTGQVTTNPVSTVQITGKPHTLEKNTILTAKGGERYYISDSAAPIVSDNNKILGVILVFKDITDEIEAQEKLEHSQRIDAIGQLAGGVAHDFNNMLGGIIGFAELLDQKVSKDDESKMFVDMIINTSERAAELTNKLLTFARRGKVPSTSLDCHQVLLEAIELLKRTVDKRITFFTNFKAPEYFVVGDPSQLQNVIINIGINSARAMKEGGKITFSSENVIINYDDCSLPNSKLTPGKFLKIIITDTGIGIPKENIPKIFEPFFTTKEDGKGAGLGLATAYGIIQQHNGDISVTSVIGSGTTITILLPISEKKEKNISERLDIGKKNTEHILFVDDEYVMRVTAKAILVGEGYKVTTASDGEEALNLFTANPKDFDLVILDMIMPKMNGKDCFTNLRTIDKDIKVILSSGFSQEEDVKEMREKGLNGFIAKPYNSRSLNTVINDVLR